MTAAAVRCKDCRADGISAARPAPHPGPRCATQTCPPGGWAVAG